MGGVAKTTQIFIETFVPSGSTKLLSQNLLFRNHWATENTTEATQMGGLCITKPCLHPKIKESLDTEDTKGIKIDQINVLRDKYVELRWTLDKINCGLDHAEERVSFYSGYISQ